MIKNILTILTIFLLTQTNVKAHDCTQNQFPQKPTFQEQRKINSMLNEKLNLTKEQKEIIEKNRYQHKKEMNKIIDKMKDDHDKIKEVYMIGLPKYQADIRTAPMKADLVKLKMEADRLKVEHRKSFESVLNDEQKIEFEKLRKEYTPKDNKTYRHP